MKGMTTDIYFELKDKDNDANTNEITDREIGLSAKSILTIFPAPNIYESVADVPES